MTPAGEPAVTAAGFVRAAVVRGHQEAAGHRRVWNHLPARTFPRESLREKICGRFHDTQEAHLMSGVTPLMKTR